MESENHRKVPGELPELRMDLASKDWVIIAGGRSQRPNKIKSKKKVFSKIKEKDCFFCHDKISSQEILFENKSAVVIKNKFPIVRYELKKLGAKMEMGIYKSMNAIGFHEVVVFKNHQRQIWDMATEEIKEILEAYVARYLDLQVYKFVNYISVFHNSGRSAGASIEHPHSQIITTTLIDKDLKRALNRSKRYYLKNKKCLPCEMNLAEMKVRKRIFFENENFIVFCPFASKTAFEVIISPRKHLACFEAISREEKVNLAECFKVAFNKLNKALSGPDYNFYLSTSPNDGKKCDYYHWHWTILPKTEMPAGFELETMINVCITSPEKAAEILKNL